jgi:hypothetical protein
MAGTMVKQCNKCSSAGTVVHPGMVPPQPDGTAKGQQHPRPREGRLPPATTYLPRLPAGFHDPGVHFVAPRPLKPKPGLVTQANGLT